MINCSHIFVPGEQVLSPLKDGIVADWDIVDSIWDHAFRLLPAFL